MQNKLQGLMSDLESELRYYKGKVDNGNGYGSGNGNGYGSVNGNGYGSGNGNNLDLDNDLDLDLTTQYSSYDYDYQANNEKIKCSIVENDTIIKEDINMQLTTNKSKLIGHGHKKKEVRRKHSDGSSIAVQLKQIKTLMDKVSVDS
jgi:hypothetical protein